jgi:hypothetical protein
MIHRQFRAHLGQEVVSNPHGKYTDDSSSPNYGRTRLEVQLLDLAEGFLN